MEIGDDGGRHGNGFMVEKRWSDEGGVKRKLRLINAYTVETTGESK